MDDIVSMFNYCSIHDDLNEITNMFSGIKFDDKPKLYNYLADDFRELAKEYNTIMTSLDKNIFHMVFDPKPDIDIFSDSQTNAELIKYLNGNRKGYSMLSDLIEENYHEHVILDMNTIESLVDYYIECIQME
jgi:hypothetical protein